MKHNADGKGENFSLVKLHPNIQSIGVLIKREKDIKVMKKVLKSILNWIMFLLTGKGEIARESVDDGIIDYSGQGRNEYGN